MHVTQGVRVLKIAGGKIQLTMKSEEDRRDEAELADRGVGAGSTRKARNTLEAALAKVGYKHTPAEEEKTEVSNALLNCCHFCTDSSRCRLLSAVLYKLLLKAW